MYLFLSILDASTIDLARTSRKSDPGYLGRLVYMGSNRKAYMPPVKDIFQRYLRKFSKAGKLLEADGLGFADAPAAADAPAPAPAPASASPA